MRRYISIFCYFVNTVIILSLFVLQRLINTKAGVNHHVIARREQLAKTIFNNDNIHIIVLGTSLALAIALICLAIAIKKKRTYIHHILGLNIVISAIFYLLHSKIFESFVGSYYILMGLGIVALIQTVICIFNFKRDY
ncbi:MAG: hypothetical protein ACRDA4_01940 [Filifactoraceae bacterium]